MIKLSEWLAGVSNRSVVLAGLVIFVLFVILVLPAQPKIGVTDDFDPGYPDLGFWYSPGHLYDIAEAYGPEGRMEYVKMRYRFDIVWPLVYVGFLVTSLSWVLIRVSVSRKILLLNLLPVPAGCFDLLENLFASIVMLRYPAFSPVSAFLTPVMTMLKWSLIGLSFAALAAGLAVLTGRMIRNRFS